MASATAEASIPTCLPVRHEYPGDDVFSDSASVSLLQFCVLASRLLVAGTLVAHEPCDSTRFRCSESAYPVVWIPRAKYG